MLVEFYFELRKGGIPASLTEFLVLLEAMEHRVAGFGVEDFYFLSRAALVKDERHFDRFDAVFGGYFRGREALFEAISADVPPDWLERRGELLLDEEERRRIQSLGGWDALMRALRERLAEQDGPHAGGSKWIGTAGTSPFGAHGHNPEGVRVGQGARGRGTGVKVWDRREFRNLDDRVELGVRNMKLALRRLRRFARDGAPTELDLDDTITCTARNGGMLDLRMVPERHNAVKVLLLLDAGGSMDFHVRTCEELFSAVRSEFRHLEYFYFHNCIYESLWKDNRRRHTERIPTVELMRTFGKDYKLILVGDASMSPYEITYAGGSVEHWNAEPGQLWLTRLLGAYAHAVWLNPEPETQWEHMESTRMIRRIMGGRMYPLTLDGLEQGIAALKRSH